MTFPDKIMVGTTGRDLVIGHDGKRMYPDELMPHVEYVQAAALAEAQAEIARLRGGEVAANSTSLDAAQRQVDEMRTALELCQQLGSATVQRIARAALEAKHG